MTLAGPIAALLAAAVALAGAGCDRRVDPYVAPEAEPPASANPVRIPQLAQTRVDPRQVAAPLMDPGAGRASGADVRPAATSPEEQAKTIRGTIRLAQGARAPDQGVLFVIARVPGMRPPLAVLRLPAGPFPLEFSIGPKDRVPMMGQNVPFEGPIELSARVDLDGNAMSRSPGELAGSAGEVQPGATGIDIALEPQG